MASEFLWSDAWFLAALSRASSEGKLAELIALADGLNHAIITREEINGAIGRLVRAGYVRIEPGAVVRVTEAGRAIATPESAGHIESVSHVQRALSARPWSPSHKPTHAGAGEAEVVAEHEYDEALKDYYRMAGFRDGSPDPRPSVGG